MSTYVLTLCYENGDGEIERERENKNTVYKYTLSMMARRCTSERGNTTKWRVNVTEKNLTLTPNNNLKQDKRFAQRMW